MKKTIITGAICLAVGSILSPIAGMAIGETRNLILGLAPEEAITQLADKIDTNNVGVQSQLSEKDQKITELQSIIDSQQSQITDSQKQIETAKDDVKVTQQAISKQVDCAKLYSDNQYCNQKDYRDKKSFDKYTSHDWLSKEQIERAENKFDKCQEIIQSCGY